MKKKLEKDNCKQSIKPLFLKYFIDFLYVFDYNSKWYIEIPTEVLLWEGKTKVKGENYE